MLERPCADRRRAGAVLHRPCRSCSTTARGRGGSGAGGCPIKGWGSRPDIAEASPPRSAHAFS
eukprot:15477857-Alexandrium_andersonii.AAC.1